MTTQTPLNQTAASTAAVARAQAAIAEFPSCFWVRRPDAPIGSVADVQLIVQRLRQYGNRQAWETALEIERCL